MKKNIIAISAVTVIAIAAIAAPKVGDSIVENLLKEQSETLKKNGLEINFTNKEGYINTTRDFTATVTDGSDLITYLVNKNTKDPKIKEDILKEISKNEVEYDKSLNGMVFKGNAKNSNIAMGNVVLDFYLSDISEENKKDMKNKEVLEKVLSEKKIAFIANIENNGILDELTMKDTTFEIKKEDGFSSNMSIKDFTLYKVVTDKKIFSLGELTIKANNTKDNSNLDFKISNVDVSYSYTDKINNSSEFSISELKINTKNSVSNDLNLMMKNLDITSESKTLDFASHKTTFNVETIDYSDKQNSTSISNLKTLVSISKINKEAIENISKIKYGKTITEDQKNKLIVYGTKIINSGMTVNASVSFVDLNNKKENLSFGETSISVEATLPKNELKLDSQQEMLMAAGIIEVDSKISLQEKDLGTISKIQPMIGLYAQMAEKVGNVLKFNIKYKQGVLTINEKPLQ